MMRFLLVVLLCLPAFALGHDESECFIPAPPVRVEYSLEHQTIPGIPFDIRVRAVGYRPAVVTPDTPVVLVALMNMARCYYGSGHEYDCPNNDPLPIMEGMDYLTEALAKAGAIAVTMDFGQVMVDWQVDSYTQVIGWRVALTLEHMNYWSDQGQTRFMAVGHSMGGETVLEVNKLVPLEALYLLAPVVDLSGTLPDNTGLLVSACDEEPGLHNLPSIKIFDASIGLSELEMAYLPTGSHHAYNETAPDWWPNGMAPCTVPHMDSDEQRRITAELVSRWFMGTNGDIGEARTSNFTVPLKPLTPSFYGFSAITPCNGYGCEPQNRLVDYNPYWYYATKRPSTVLEWDGLATIEPNGPGLWKMRVTYSLADPRNADGVTLSGQIVPPPANHYLQPCKPRSTPGLWTCTGWWQLPREVPHTMYFSGPIILTGAGRIIISDVERL